MSRSGYTDDGDDGWALIRWRGAVSSAIRGRRGQAMLVELLQALDALPEKRLVADSLATADGDYCALGALGKSRGLEMSQIDPDDREAVAQAFGIAEALAAEIMYFNDSHVDDWVWRDVELCGPVRPHFPFLELHTKTVKIHDEHAAEQRWVYMRNWVKSHIKTSPAMSQEKGKS